MASSRYGTSRRLTMNAVASLACTGTLPTERTNSVAAFADASSVRIVRTTSTSFMSGTGLKKCMPTTCPGRLVAAAIAVTLQDEVLLASSADAGQMRSSLANVSFFSAWFSVIASITRSHALRSSRRGVPAMRPSVSSLARASSLPLAASPSSVSRRRPSPRFTSSSLASTNSTEYPACAATCTMPEPMSPHPITPTFLIAMVDAFFRSATAARTGRWLEEVAAGRTVVADDDRAVAVADRAVRLDHRLGLLIGGRRAVAPQRFVEGAVARGRRRLRHLEDDRAAHRRLRLVVGSGHGRQAAPEHQRPEDPSPHGPYVPSSSRRRSTNAAGSS